MNDLICPVCGGDLKQYDRTLKCERGHSYDIARQGYCNLLMSNQSSLKHHGDDKMMIAARRDFLDRGYYNPLRDAIVNAVLTVSGDSPRIIDSGCGDCWYTEAVYKSLCGAGKSPEVTGIDISKDALIAGGRRTRELTLCVASASKLPVKSAWADILLNIFSPFEPEEFSRVIKPKGHLIRALPMEHHLWSLKRAVYATPYPNPPVNLSLTGFDLIGTTEVLESLNLTSKEDIQNLFKMTPYYYKTGREDQQKLLDLDSLTVELEVIVALYKKI